MTKVTKEYTVFDREDVEQVVSKAFGKPVKLEEMEVILYDVFSPVWEEINMISISFKVGDITIPKYYVDDDDEECEGGPLDSYIQELSAGTSEYLIFNFSTDLFKSFKRKLDFPD